MLKSTQTLMIMKNFLILLNNLTILLFYNLLQLPGLKI